jgi:uncharacterized protein YecT (DUF1311 family)
MKKIILVAGLLFALSTVHAETCDDAQTQMKMNQCAAQDLAKENKNINWIYKKVMGTLSKNEKSQLKALELRWIREKDTTCKAEAAENAGGSMEQMVLNMCLARLTKERSEWLKENY